jgi:uncharacterized BrkB/YihY/UPF0761 family membrane protein
MSPQKTPHNDASAQIPTKEKIRTAVCVIVFYGLIGALVVYLPAEPNAKVPVWAGALVAVIFAIFIVAIQWKRPWEGSPGD